MEPITAAIISALSVGAASGVTDTAKKAVVDAYGGLKALINKKFGSNSGVKDAIDNLQAKPESPGRRETLAEELRTTNASTDPELLAAAQSLLELIKALPQGEQHFQSAQGTGIAQADRGGTAWVNMAGLTGNKDRD